MSQTKNQSRHFRGIEKRYLCTALIIGSVYTTPYNAIAQTPATIPTAQDCQEISDPERRLRCYDGLFAKPVQNTTPSTTPEFEEVAPFVVTLPPKPVAPPTPTPAPAPAPSVESFGERNKSDALTRPVASKQGKAAAPKKITSLTQRVAKLDMFGYKKLRITLENGQVWEQIGSVTNRPPKMSSKRPLVAEIKEAALGSFSLQFNGKGRAIKVKRVR